MRDSDRNQIGLVYITRDITQRKKVEAEIVQYRYHLEEIVEDRTAELNQSMGKLRTTLDGIVVSMGYALESRDQYTAGHQHRVAEVASEIARVMGLPDNTIEGIRMAGLIHDIGKIYVPSEILNKHGKLDEVEFMMIKKHPQVGYDILKSIDFPWPIAEIVYQHHEKMNGSGYPRGLKDGEILLEAKIICVADVIEAMTIDRPYKGGVGIEGALEEVDMNKGVLYDPAVVDSCLKLFREKGYRFN
jgi:putative two-component system response regulator